MTPTENRPQAAPDPQPPKPGGAADQGLKRQVASGMFWVALGQIFGRGLGYVTTLILAKLVTPQQFGLVGMAGLALAALALFQDIGFEAALVYKRGAKQEVDAASHTAFYTVILTSLVICAISMLAAPLVAAFFREPAVVPILRVLSLTVVISSFGRVPYVLLSRDLNFRRRLFPDLTASIIASIIAIVMAFRGFGVWSLVWRELIKTTLATVLVFFVCPYRPRWQFSRPAARELFGYGKHIMSSQGLIFLITNVDNAVVGRYLGDSALGFYQFAYNTSNQPATQLTSVVSQVMFPALSKMGDSDPDAARASAHPLLLHDHPLCHLDRDAGCGGHDPVCARLHLWAVWGCLGAGDRALAGAGPVRLHSFDRGQHGQHLPRDWAGRSGSPISPPGG